MNENPDPKVPFSTENISRCRCPGCPVQTSSQCVNEKLGKLSEVMKSAGKVPGSQDVPGVYCSTGVAACKDLDPSKSCICGTCAVWQHYNLVSGKPASYFCKNGMAK
jgi:hypothetical protein